MDRPGDSSFCSERGLTGVTSSSCLLPLDKAHSNPRNSQSIPIWILKSASFSHSMFSCI